MLDLEKVKEFGLEVLRKELEVHDVLDFSYDGFILREAKLLGFIEEGSLTEEEVYTLQKEVYTQLIEDYKGVFGYCFKADKFSHEISGICGIESIEFYYDAAHLYFTFTLDACNRVCES